MRAAGVREFLTKPVETEDLVAAIAAHCDRQRRS
jgi:DNA-binding response OmpR family regulator